MSLELPAPAETPIKQTSLDSYSESLLYRMHLTKGARYQAARRHQRRSTASLWSVIALSMYVFTVSAVLAIYDLSQKGNIEKELVISNIVMSAFIIAFSVLEQGKKHDLKADLFLRCAQGIQGLRDKLELEVRLGTVTNKNISNYVDQYNAIVHDFADNHSETDYRTFRINIGKDTGLQIYRYYYTCKYWLDCWLIMIFAIFIPPLTFLLLLNRAG